MRRNVGSGSPLRARDLGVDGEPQLPSTIIGSGQAPYINSLADSCGVATNYHNISHPSLPNYIAATSGLPLASLSVFDGDCDVSRSCSTTAPSIFGQGESWKAYEESMPKDCDRAELGRVRGPAQPSSLLPTLAFCKPPTAARHGAKVGFDVPYAQLANDLNNNSLPAFSFITPNLIDDMHDGTTAQGDAWLSENLPGSSSRLRVPAGQVVVFVTWDEGEGGRATTAPKTPPTSDATWPRSSSVPAPGLTRDRQHCSTTIPCSAAPNDCLGFHC